MGTVLFFMGGGGCQPTRTSPRPDDHRGARLARQVLEEHLGADCPVTVPAGRGFDLGPDERAIAGLPLGGVLPEGFVEGIEGHQRIMPTLRVDPVARPRVGVRGGHHPRADRVELDVGATLEEVVVLRDEQTLETILPEVAGVAVPSLVGQGVAEVEALHGLAQTYACRSFDNQVHVVRHEAVVVEVEAVFREVGGNESTVALEVGLIMKDRCAVVPTGQNVVAATIHQEPSLAWHTDSSSTKIRTVPYFPNRPLFSL